MQAVHLSHENNWNGSPLNHLKNTSEVEKPGLSDYSVLFYFNFPIYITFSSRPRLHDYTY